MLEALKIAVMVLFISTACATIGYWIAALVAA